MTKWEVKQWNLKLFVTRAKKKIYEQRIRSGEKHHKLKCFRTTGDILKQQRGLRFSQCFPILLHGMPEQSETWSDTAGSPSAYKKWAGFSSSSGFGAPPPSKASYIPKIEFKR